MQENQKCTSKLKDIVMQNKHQIRNKLAMTKHVGKNKLAPSRIIEHAGRAYDN